MWDMHTGYIQEGKRIGKKEGKLEGKLETTISYVERLLTHKNMSLSEAIDLLDVSDDIKDDVIKHFNN